MLSQDPRSSFPWRRALTGWLVWTLSTIGGAAFGMMWAFVLWWPIFFMLAISASLTALPSGLKPPFPLGPWLAAISASLVLTITGGCVAFGQVVAFYGVLARDRHITWIRTTTLGSLGSGAILSVGTFLFDMWSQPTLWVLAASTLLGVSQWSGLRKHSRLAWVWVPTTVLSLLGGARFIPGPYPLEDSPLMSLIGPVVLYSAVTGVVIVWITLGHLDPAQQPEVQSTGGTGPGGEG